MHTSHHRRGQGYYQIIGTRSHWPSYIHESHDYDYDKLSKRCFDQFSPCRHEPGGYVELVLGIRNDDSTSLLIPEEWERSLLPTSRRRLSNPYPPSDFVSLSPVRFGDQYALKRRLKEISKSDTKRKHHSAQNDADEAAQSSRRHHANNYQTSYSTYEQTRVFWCVLISDIDSRMYNVSLSWRRSFSLIGLSFTPWSFDNRSRKDRALQPKLRDIAWAEIDLTTLTTDLQFPTLQCIQSNDLKLLGQGNLQKGEFKFGVSEEGSSSDSLKLFMDFLKKKLATCRAIVILSHDLAPDNVEQLTEMDFFTGEIALWTHFKHAAVY